MKAHEDQTRVQAGPCGAFAVLLPAAPWDWISGTALLPGNIAQPLMKKLGAKARMMSVQQLASHRFTPMNTDEKMKANPTRNTAPTQPSAIGVHQSSSVANPSFPMATPANAPDDVAVADVVVRAGFLQAVSGLSGAFAVPALVPPEAAALLPVQGERRDLGVTGHLSAPVPSGNHLLRLATVPFRVLNAAPANGSLAPVGSVVLLMLSGPADPASIGAAKLFREAGATPDLIEVPVRRSLSQDGKTLFLTPEQPLDQGTSYRILTEGLASLGGERAPAFDSRFQTAALPPLSSEVDFSRVRLSYPDEAFTVTVTIPEGAIPPRAVVELEASGMGSYATGTMLDKGDLVFTIKAALGERLKIRVQLKDGRVVEGFLSRYESNDGSGRVTLSVDGGRVEAPDGSCAVSLPEGALDRPVELRTQFTQAPAEDLLPELQETVPIFGRVQLLAREAVQFKKLPRIEMKAPEGTQDLGEFKGFGGYSIYFRNTDLDQEGQPATFYEFMDTAKVEAGTLKGLGGLPWNLLEDEMPPEAADQGPLPRSERSAMEQSKAFAALSATDPTAIKCYVGVDDFPNVRYFSGSGFMGMRTDDSFTVELDGMIVKNPGKIILKGRARTTMPDGRSYLTVRAPLLYTADNSVDVNIQGKMLTRTNECGSYMLMNASFFGDPLQDSGTLLAIEPDFGIRHARPKAIWNLWQTDTKNDRKLYQIPGFNFKVESQQMGDQAPPWAVLDFAGPNYMGSGLAKAGPLDVVIQAKDARSATNLRVEVRVNNQVAATCESSSGEWVPSGAYTFKPGSAGSGVWIIHLELGEGTHTVEALIADIPAGNTTRLRRDLQVMDYSGISARLMDPTRAPSFEVIVSGGLESAKPNTLVKVQFSEPVKGLTQDTLYLEKLEGTLWQRVGDTRLSLGLVAPEVAAVAWILPGSLLELDTRYRVVAASTVKDCDPDTAGGPKALNQEPVEFHVQSHLPLGTVAIPSVRKVTAIGRSVFAVDGSNRLHMLLAMDHGLSEQAVFGDFQGQYVDAMVAFENAVAPGMKWPGLLLVTTTPSGSAYSQNGALWGFQFCTGTGQVEPLFSMSLGNSMSGYSPGVDYRDGIIAVGRLTNSVALIRLEDAIAKAPHSPATVVSPGGFGQGAIFQPFYLSDPDYQWKEGLTTTLTSGSNYGVALAPVSMELGEQQILRTVVAYGGDLTAQLKDVPIAGLPSYWLTYTPGAIYTPVRPFVADAESLAISKTRRAAPASAYASTGLVSGGAATHMVSLWPNASVWIQGEKWKTTIGVGIGTAAKAPAGGNGLVVMNVNETDTSGKPKVWIWPKVSPFGAGVPYEIQYRKASLDPATGLCAVEVKNRATNKVSWFILDLTRPEDPPIVDTFLDSEGAGWSGTLSYGIFSATNATGVSSWRVLATQGNSALLAAAAVHRSAPSTAKAEPSASQAKPGTSKKDPVGKQTKTAPTTSPMPQSVSAQTLQKLAAKQEVAARVDEAARASASRAPDPCQVPTTETEIPVSLDFISFNQGVEQYLAGMMPRNAVPGLPMKVGDEMTNATTVVANRPIRFMVHLSATPDSPLVTSSLKVTVRLQIVPRGTTGTFSENGGVYPMGRFSSLAAMPSATVRVNSNANPLRHQFGQAKTAAVVEVRDPKLIQPEDTVQLIVESKMGRHTLEGGGSIDLNATNSDPIAIHVYPVEYIATHKGATVTVAPPTPPNVDDIKKRIEEFFPVSISQDDTFIKVLLQPSVTYSEADLVPGTNDRQARLFDPENGAPHLYQRLADTGFLPDPITPKGIFRCALVDTEALKHRLGLPPLGTTGVTIRTANNIRYHFFWVASANSTVGRTQSGVVDDLRHELGHAHGLAHVGYPTCIQDAPDRQWPANHPNRVNPNPYINAGIGVDGWNAKTFKNVSASKGKDFMSYSPADVWISDQHFAAIRRHNLHVADENAPNAKDLFAGARVGQWNASNNQWRQIGGETPFAVALVGVPLRMRVEYDGPEGKGVATAFDPAVKGQVKALPTPGEFEYTANSLPAGTPEANEVLRFQFGTLCPGAKKDVTVFIVPPSYRYTDNFQRTIRLRPGERSDQVEDEPGNHPYPGLQVLAFDPSNDQIPPRPVAWNWRLTPGLGTLVPPSPGTDPIAVQATSGTEKALGELWAEDPAGTAAINGNPKIPVEVRKAGVDFEIYEGANRLANTSTLKAGATYTLKAVVSGYDPSELLTHTLTWSLDGLHGNPKNYGNGMELVLIAGQPAPGEVRVTLTLNGWKRQGIDVQQVRSFKVVP